MPPGWRDARRTVRLPKFDAFLMRAMPGLFEQPGFPIDGAVGFASAQRGAFCSINPPPATAAGAPVDRSANRREGSVLAAVMMAIFMAAMESSIVATAMPTIVAELGGFHLFSWAFAAYLLTQAVTIPIYGRLADLYGRKRVFFAGTGLFLFGSALCGLAWGMVPLVLFRALQGTGAGAIQPIATTIIGDIYGPTERARIQGYISGVFGVAAIIGPTLGAFLVEHVTWSVVFWINLPIGAATFVMFGLFLHEHREPRRHRIDYLGSGLDDARRRRADAGAGADRAIARRLTIAALAVGRRRRCSGGAGGARARAQQSRCCRWQLWRNRVMAIGSLGGFFNGAVMMAISGLLPTYVQGAMGRNRDGGRTGARRVIGQLDLCQHRRRAA